MVVRKVLSCRTPEFLCGIWATGILLFLLSSSTTLPKVAPASESVTSQADLDLQDEQLALSARNLNAIMMALHSYHNSAGHFPTAYAGFGFDREAKEWYRHRRHLSWRVLLLPFLGEKELFDRFRLDQPWDGEHNKKLILEIPDVYRAPGSTAAEGRTNYLGIIGPNAAFSPRKTTTIIDIVDGTVQTMMVVEASDDAAVVWTRPRDISADSEKPMDALVGLRDGGFLTVFADGATSFISNDATKDFLQSLFTRNDRQPLDEMKRKKWVRFVRPTASK